MRRRQRWRRNMRFQIVSLLMWTRFNTQFFPTLKCTSTISKITFQLDHMCTSLQILHFQQFEGSHLSYKGLLHCEMYEYKEFPDNIIEAPLSKPFHKKWMKTLSRLYGFMLYGNLGVDFFSISESLYPYMNVRLQLIRVGTNFYVVSENPNVILRYVDCSLYTRHIALKDEYHKKRLDMLAYVPVKFNYLETLAKKFVIPTRKNQLIQKKI